MSGVGRREFITALGGMVATPWPLAARAQQRPESLPRIGCLVAGAADDQEARARHNAFRDSLEKLGWIDGRTISIDYRWGSRGQERTQAGTKGDLVRGDAEHAGAPGRNSQHSNRLRGRD